MNILEVLGKVDKCKDWREYDNHELGEMIEILLKFITSTAVPVHELNDLLEEFLTTNYHPGAREFVAFLKENFEEK